ncbi:unnamed protein product [Schistocephalus solidus]|uniref:Uncharacterized protein n=1 Tax=Schistocephalus solidus TaxID=70667 RepID=A0A183SL87_SCHSO|nr:unnamed protein product [Schistocephalus solidus]
MAVPRIPPACIVRQVENCNEVISLGVGVRDGINDPRIRRGQQCVPNYDGAAVAVQGGDFGRRLITFTAEDIQGDGLDGVTQLTRVILHGDVRIDDWKTKLQLGDEEVVIRSSVGTWDRLCHQHVRLISPPDENIVQEVSVSRPRLYSGRLLPHRETEEGVVQNQAMFGAERQAEADQAIFDALWQTGQMSHDVPVDGKGDTSVESHCLWPAAPEKGVASTQLLQLTLFREPGLVESSNVHLVAPQFPSD